MKQDSQESLQTSVPQCQADSWDREGRGGGDRGGEKQGCAGVPLAELHIWGCLHHPTGCSRGKITLGGVLYWAEMARPSPPAVLGHCWRPQGRSEADSSLQPHCKLFLEGRSETCPMPAALTEVAAVTVARWVAFQGTHIRALIPIIFVVLLRWPY